MDTKANDKGKNKMLFANLVSSNLQNSNATRKESHHKGTDEENFTGPTPTYFAVVSNNKMILESEHSTKHVKVNWGQITILSDSIIK